jgi:tripartite-type tricarboxylate transporter receptor subunit TctC
MIKLFKNALIVIPLVLSLSTSGIAGEKSKDFPGKPITLIVPYVPGSGADVHARMIAPRLGKHLGATVFVDNRPGADGRIALNELWKAPPNGYTLLTTGLPAPIINEKLFQVKYKFREFTQIFSWSRDNMVLVVNSETWKTLDEFFSAARAKTLSGGTTGVGSSPQFCGLALEDAAHFKPVNWIPYGGGSEIVTQLAGKHIDFGISTTSSVKPLVDAGKLRPLLIFSNEKDFMFPDAPLLKGIGLDFTPLPIVRCAMGPPGLSTQIVTILEQAFLKVARDPDFLAWAQKAQAEISVMNSKQCSSFVIDAEKEVMKYLDRIKVNK